MADSVVFFNLKGGQGKTTLAAHYALYSESYFYTNDFRSGTKDLYESLFPKGRFHLIQPDAKRKEIEDKAVFDCGGFIDQKVPTLLKNSDLCVIPFSGQSKADLRALFITVEAVRKYNERLLLVVNNTRTEDLAGILAGLQTTYKGRYPVKVVKSSRYMTYLVNEGKTPFDLREQGATAKPLAALQHQLKDLFQHILRSTNG
jgi:cellulose biosynthesis protein BcsQ